MKRIDIICVLKHLCNRIKLILSLKGEASKQNEKTCTSYSKMFNANDSLMNSTCNTYVHYSAQKTTKPQKTIMTNAFFFK